MVSMIQVSIIVTRIASTSRAVAFNTGLLSFPKRSVTTAWVKVRNDDYEDGNAQNQRQPKQPEVRYRSRLAELYDDMFEQTTDISTQSQKIFPPQSLDDKNADIHSSSTAPYVSTPPTKSNSASKENDHKLDVTTPPQGLGNQGKDPKSTNRTFVKSRKSLPKADFQGRKFKTFEHDMNEIGNYMDYMQNDFERDNHTPKEDKGTLALFEEFPTLESFPDESLQSTRITPQPPPIDIPKPRSHHVDAGENSSPNANVMEDDNQSRIQAQTTHPKESDQVPSEAVIRSINTTLQAGSMGTADPSSTLTLQSQIKHIESEVAKFNDGVSINLNSRKQLSLLLFGVPDESTSKDVLEGIAGNIANTDGKAKIASLILQYRKFVKDLKRLERQNHGNEDETHIASVQQNKDQASPRDKRVQAGSIIAPNGAHREPLVLIDASAYIFRSYYAMPPMHRYDGEPVGMSQSFSLFFLYGSHIDTNLFVI